MKRIINSLMIITCLSFSIAAQSGANFDLSHSVIASGGGQNSGGGAFSVDGTAGQNLAGATSTSGSFSLRGGFWSFDSLAPTAALVAVSGRVLTTGGQGIRNVSLKLTGANGVIRSVTTNTFGNFRFEEVEAGQTYILEATGKKFTFANPTRILSVQDEIADIEFIAEPQ